MAESCVRIRQQAQQSSVCTELAEGCKAGRTGCGKLEMTQLYEGQYKRGSNIQNWEVAQVPPLMLDEQRPREGAGS